MRKLTGAGVLSWLLVMFIPVIAVNICFIALSVHTFRGEDEQKPYLQGVEYNHTLARRAEQAKLGWRAQISAARDLSGGADITILLKAADATAESGIRLYGELRHPADEGRDRTLVLEKVQPGLYRAHVTKISRGAWDVVVSTSSDQQPFEASRRIWLP